MYDIEKCKYFDNPTIKDLVYYLELENQDAKVSCCGNDGLFLHVSEDNNIVCIDCEDNHDYYPDQDISNITKVDSSKNYPISRFRALELLTKMIDSYYNEDIIVEDLKSKGFSNSELIELGYSIKDNQNDDGKEINILNN